MKWLCQKKFSAKPNMPFVNVIIFTNKLCNFQYREYFLNVNSHPISVTRKKASQGNKVTCRAQPRAAFPCWSYSFSIGTTRTKRVSKITRNPVIFFSDMKFPESISRTLFDGFRFHFTGLLRISFAPKLFLCMYLLVGLIYNSTALILKLCYIVWLW